MSKMFGLPPPEANEVTVDDLRRIVREEVREAVAEVMGAIAARLEGGKDEGSEAQGEMSDDEVNEILGKAGLQLKS